jgi:hypothetical protein
MVGGRTNVIGTGLTINGGDAGISGPARIKIDGLTATGCDRFAIVVKSMRLRHASLDGGTQGIFQSERVELQDSTMTGYSGTAIEAGRITLIDSTVTGNGLDLDAERSPKLRRSTCETSNGWGVCTND